MAADGRPAVTDGEALGPSLVCARRQAERLRELRRSATVFDTIRTQLGELLETRAPERKLARAELESEIDRRLGSAADEYGLWVYYPWSARLVHVLPREEYLELRSSRNRNKITASEQQRLGALTLGVAGLSVGQATAVTLALEGLGGTLRLADFDVLSLSNMNRLRAGVHEIGVNKAVITARAIWEFNPYLEIELFEDGITDANLARFLDGLDLLFEECDDLKMKVLLREQARRRRIPVLMESSDRGLLDVERFDLEPERPLFHGLVGELRAEQLAGLSTYEKVPVVLALLGADTMSPRLAGSLVDVEVSLKTWPQLASAVALGGAINTDAARRVALGQLQSSGRYFVDLEQLVADAKEQRAGSPPNAGKTAAPPARAERKSSEPQRLTGPLSREELETVVPYAAFAPSGGNCQPWRFVYRAPQGLLECWHVPERSRSFLDFEQRASYLAFGAVAENIRLAGVRLGLDVQLEALPEPGQPELMCVAHLTPARGRPESCAPAQRWDDEAERSRGANPSLDPRDRDRLLAAWVPARVTNRRLGTRAALSETLVAELVGLVEAPCALWLAREPAALRAFGDLHGETERLRMLHPVMHREMMDELRWSRREAEQTRDGIELATLELTPTERAGMSVLKRADVTAVLRRIAAGEGLAVPSRKALAGASAVGVLTSDGSEPSHYFQAGRSLQKLWLLANARGLALQPMTAMLFVFARLERDGLGLEAQERAAFAEARAELRALFSLPAGAREIFAFRLAHAAPPSARALRRPLEQILEVR